MPFAVAQTFILEGIASASVLEGTASASVLKGIAWAFIPMDIASTWDQLHNLVALQHTMVAFIIRPYPLLHDYLLIVLPQLLLP